MKKLLLIPALLLTTMSLSSFDTISYTTTYSQPALPGAEMIAGLKQALEQGITKSTEQLSAVDGFFKNPTIKIVLPPDAEKAEKTLRKLGLNKLCDDAILSLNRAAEDAAKQARPIFLNALRQMSVQDAANILFGANDAATQYFKRTTTAQLVIQFKPVIHASLDKVGATRYYGQIASEYNKVPFVHKLNPDLDDYATQKAIDGLFYEIALEELNIRQNLSARTTVLLQKVFGVVDDRMRKQ